MKVTHGEKHVEEGTDRGRYLMITHHAESGEQGGFAVAADAGLESEKGA